MSVQRSSPLVDETDRPVPRLLLRAVELVLAIVLLPPLLAAAVLVGIYAGGEWVAFRIHDVLRPDEPRLGRALWGRLGSRVPAPHASFRGVAGPHTAAAIPQVADAPGRPHRGEARRGVSRTPSARI